MSIEWNNCEGANERLRAFLHEAAELDGQGMVVALWFQKLMVAQIAGMQNRVRGGSRAGKAPNKNRDFAAGHHRLVLDNYWPQGDILDDGSG
jgi:hypothetical protein